MTAATTIDGTSLLFAANFFNNYAGSAATTGIYEVNNQRFTPIALSNPAAGGIGQLVVAPGGAFGVSLALVSDTGDGLIHLFGLPSNAALYGQSTYLTLAPGSRPTYMTEFNYTGTIRSGVDPGTGDGGGTGAVPEPTSLALLGLGAIALGTTAFRRARPARAA